MRIPPLSRLVACPSIQRAGTSGLVANNGKAEATAAALIRPSASSSAVVHAPRAVSRAQPARGKVLDKGSALARSHAQVRHAPVASRLTCRRSSRAYRLPSNLISSSNAPGETTRYRARVTCKIHLPGRNQLLQVASLCCLYEPYANTALHCECESARSYT